MDPLREGARFVPGFSIADTKALPPNCQWQNFHADNQKGTKLTVLHQGVYIKNYEEKLHFFCQRLTSSIVHIGPWTHAMDTLRWLILHQLAPHCSVFGCWAQVIGWFEVTQG